MDNLVLIFLSGMKCSKFRFKCRFVVKEEEEEEMII